MAAKTTTRIECDRKKCPVSILVGEKDTPQEAFNLVQVRIGNGEEYWFCSYAHLIEWAHEQKPLFDPNDKVEFDDVFPGAQ